MSYAITLSFDEATDIAIRKAWWQLADAGLSEFMLHSKFDPHVTLEIYEQVDMPALQAALSSFLATATPIPVKFSHLGVFPGAEGAIFLGLTWHRALMDFHTSFCQMVSSFLSGANEYYLPETWVPHVTLAYGLKEDQVGRAINFLRQRDLPDQGRLTRIMVTEMGSEGNKLLFSAELGMRGEG